MTAQLPDQDRLDRAISELLDLPMEGDCSVAMGYYRLALERSWNAMERLIGPLGALAVFQYSLRSTSQLHPRISFITASDKGLNLTAVEVPPSPEARLQMCRAMRELISSVLRTLSELTGDVLLGPLLAEMRDNHPREGSRTPELEDKAQ